MNGEWLSAYLDDEIDDADRIELEAALARDPELVAELDELRRVRALLRGAEVEPRPGAIERVVAAVAAADGEVVRLAARRRVPTFAAVAAALVIIASVVGGVGGSSSVPALGDLVARHEAAAAGEMPPMDDGDPVPMDEATTMAPGMPADYSMTRAFADSSVVHLVYVSGQGVPVSVFRQDGEPDMEALEGGTTSRAHGDTMWSSTVSSSSDGTAYVVVLDGDGYVWVLVSAEPYDDMDTMMIDLPSRSPSILDRARDVADSVVSPFRVWD